MSKTPSDFSTARHTPSVLVWLTFAGAIIITFAALMLLLNAFPDLPDFHVYHALARKWITGEALLYDSGGRNFFNAPWIMVILAPLALLPEKTAAAIWVAATLILIVAALHAFRVGVEQ